MNRLRLSRILMAGTILLLVAFQCYWLQKLYKEEYNSLQRRVDILLKETVQQIQADRMKNIPLLTHSGNIDIGTDTGFRRKVTVTSTEKEPAIDSLLSGRSGRHFNIVMKGVAGDKDNHADDRYFHDDYPPPPPVFNMALAKVIDSLRQEARRSDSNARNASQRIKHLVFELSKLNDSISLVKLDSQYRKMLVKEGVALPFQLKTAVLPNRHVGMDSVPVTDRLGTRFAMLGFGTPLGYYAIFGNPFSYVVGKLLLPVGISLLLVGITVISFVFLYRNLLAQQRLAVMKNEFISNITHELKTPVATVSVAIEALRNFNALQDGARTKEYLDISAIELQRLNLLIDKVLRLSMFENRKVVLQPEPVDIVALVENVIASMRLQMEKAGVGIELEARGAIVPIGLDRLHTMSIIYNLLDNALKYSRVQPEIRVRIYQENEGVVISVTDNGIGIPAAYTQRIFEKFFRVPSHDRHDIRGYGLGLSYVAHIVQLHRGTIQVQSEEGKGSVFTIKLPLVHEQN